MIRLALAIVVLLVPAAAHAQARVVSERADAVAVTVYPPLFGMGLAMITETRTVDLPAGPVRVSFRGVADQMVAQTVAVQGLPDEVGEQNFDYQLLTPGSLIRASEGRMVTLVRTNPANGRVTQERARIVSGENGAVLDIAGRIEALDCAAMPERLVFDDLPPGFVARPTLSVDLVSPRAGRARLVLSYLATGVSWQANYVARLRPDGSSMDLTGWITIGNLSDTTFPDAPIQVIAGRLERRPGETRPVSPQVTPFFPACWDINSGRTLPMDVERELVLVTGRAVAMAAAPPPPPPPPAPPPPPPAPAPPEDLGDYKLYTLPEPTTLAARQTKQLLMFEQAGVDFRPVQRRLLTTAFSGGRARSDQGPVPTATILEMENETAAGLGLALPEGRVAVFAATPHGPMLLGEPRVQNTPVGAPFELPLSANPLIQSQARVVSSAAEGEPGRQVFRTEMEVTLTNASASPALAQVRERGGARGLVVLNESAPHSLKNGDLLWQVELAAGASDVVRYTLQWGP